jgi:hypothetical protein
MKGSKFIYDVQVSKVCWFSVSYQTVVNLTLIVLIGAYSTKKNEVYKVQVQSKWEISQNHVCCKQLML